MIIYSLGETFLISSIIINSWEGEREREIPLEEISPGLHDVRDCSFGCLSFAIVADFVDLHFRKLMIRLVGEKK